VLPEESAAQVERIRQSAQHLLYLMNELLTFTRLDAGHEELHPRELDVRDVVREIVALVEPSVTERGLRLETSVPTEPVWLRTDPDQLRLVLLNLAGNAVKYTQAGTVRLRLSAVEQGAEVQVKDTGMGISEEDLARIYEPFWQAASAQRSPEQGTGLGLSIVRRLVDLLGASLRVESTLGDGTTFTVLVRSISG
jgi:signal transduction histidine kinase